jgi:3-hydroxyacyl-[acyl-carrier-protein] dehydratase
LIAQQIKDCLMRFAFVDRILQLEPGKEAVIRKNVSNSEDFFPDQFSGRPIMPGCLILETCDQAARLVLGSGAGFTRLAVLERGVNGKFRYFVQPGDTLRVNIPVISLMDMSAEVRANASVGEQSVAQVSLTYQLVDLAQDGTVASQMREFFGTLGADPVSIALEGRARATSQGREARDA